MTTNHHTDGRMNAEIGSAHRGAGLVIALGSVVVLGLSACTTNVYTEAPATTTAPATTVIVPSTSAITVAPPQTTTIAPASSIADESPVAIAEDTHNDLIVDLTEAAAIRGAMTSKYPDLEPSQLGDARRMTLAAGQLCQLALEPGMTLSSWAEQVGESNTAGVAGAYLALIVMDATCRDIFDSLPNT